MKNNKISAKTRIIISFSVTFLAVLLIWIVLVIYIINTETIREAEEKTAIMSNMTLAVHNYFSNVLKPHLFNQIDQGKFECDFDPVWMSSSYVISRIKKDFTYINRKGYEYKHSSINARNYIREAVSEEKEFIKRMNNDNNLTEKKFIKKENGKYYYYFFKKGEVIEDSCLKCHGNPDDAPTGLVEIYGNIRGFNKKVGEVTSVEVYKIPIERILMNNIKVILIFIITFIIIILFIFVFLTSIMNNWIFRPLKKIKMHSLNISDDTNLLNARINADYGPDLNEIINAFNNMNKKLLGVYNEQDKIINAKTEELKIKNKELEKILAESNHRIKNNLALISGLISFRLMNTDSEYSKKMLKDIDGKIKAFSLIHDKLYNSKNYLTIDTKEYFDSLFLTLVSTYNVENRKINYQTEFVSLKIEVKKVVNISIIISELVINAFKYGLNNTKNILNLYFLSEKNNIILSCKNSCKNIPVMEDFKKENGLGFSLINDFVKKYNGKININLEGYVEIIIIFPKNSIIG